MGGRLRKKCPTTPPPPPSSPDSVLSRLDKMDIRLKQLEQNQMTGSLLPPLSETYFPPEQSLNCYPPQQQQIQRNRNQQMPHQRVPSVSSTVHDVLLKGSLMTRLRFLESRILQLSFELGDGSSSSEASSSMTRLTSPIENGWAIQSLSTSDGRRVAAPAASPPWKLAVGLAPWKLGLGRRLRRRMASKKGKDLKEALEAAEKKAAAAMSKETKRISGSRRRRWFPLGC